MQQGGPVDIVRPSLPSSGLDSPLEGLRTNQIDQLARTLSAINRKLELLSMQSTQQSELLVQLTQTVATTTQLEVCRSSPDAPGRE
jgi:hypothetical protein